MNANINTNKQKGKKENNKRKESALNPEEEVLTNSIYSIKTLDNLAASKDLSNIKTNAAMVESNIQNVPNIALTAFGIAGTETNSAKNLHSKIETIQINQEESIYNDYSYDTKGNYNNNYDFYGNNNNNSKKNQRNKKQNYNNENNNNYNDIANNNNKAEYYEYEYEYDYGNNQSYQYSNKNYSYNYSNKNNKHGYNKNNY